MASLLPRLLIATLVTLISVSSAHATPHQRTRAAFLATVSTATDCLANRIQVPHLKRPIQPSTLVRPIWSVITNGGCHTELATMIRRHDSLHGPGTGLRFFYGPYLADVPLAVARRLNKGRNQHRETPPHAPRSASIAVPAIPNAPVNAADVSTTGTIAKRPLPSWSSDVGKRGGAHPMAVFLWGSMISLVVLMAIGSSDRFLVFVNLSDLAWTAGVVFIPLAALFLVPLTAGMMLPKDAPMMSWRMVIDYPLYGMTVALIGATWVYSVVVTVARPIIFNGWVLGLIIAALKLVNATLIAILALIVWTLWMNEHRQKRRPNGALIATMFALLGWIGFCLINGDRFFERRNQQSA